MANAISWTLRIIAALILLQTLFFKFTGAPESVYIFTKVGAVELIAAILLLTPRWNWLGSLLAIGLMVGAIGAHLTLLGVEVQGDRGLLFGLAWAVLVTAAVNLLLHRTEIPYLGAKLG
jgi:hypothetical protein